MTLREAIEKTLVANELEGQLALAYEFSDPDGVRTGKSGWSFGRAQFDLQNNPLARQILFEAGFQKPDIDGLVSQIWGDEVMVRFNKRLIAQAAVIDKWDAEWVGHMIVHVQKVVDLQCLKLESDEVFVLLVDYHNQLDLAPRGFCARRLAALGRTIAPADILKIKLDTAWGRKRPDDVERRFRNVLDIFSHARIDEIRKTHNKE